MIGRGIILSLMLAGGVFAESGTGKLCGSVVDEYGDGVLGAPVLILESMQGVTVQTLDGSYEIEDVEPGVYTVRVMSIGFEPDTAAHVIIQSGLTTTVNFTLTEWSKEKRRQMMRFEEPLHAVKLDKPIADSTRKQYRVETVNAPASILRYIDNPVRVRRK